MKSNTPRASHRSGSPSAWKLRRETYRQSSGPVSNPNRPSLTNRKARRAKPTGTSLVAALLPPESP